jgi:hypothetical protein
MAGNMVLNFRLCKIEAAVRLKCGFKILLKIIDICITNLENKVCNIVHHQTINSWGEAKP